MSKLTSEERRSAANALIAQYGLTAGKRIYTMVTHRSRSGMSRDVRVFVVMPALLRIAKEHVYDGEPQLAEITMLVARALGMRESEHGIRVGGCGFDAGHHVFHYLVHELSEDPKSFKHERM